MKNGRLFTLPGASFCVALLLTAACSNEPATVSKPLYAAVLYDQSGSSDENALPELTVDHLEKLIAVLKHRGGELAFAEIGANSFKPLARLSVRPILGKRLGERARQNQRNQARIDRFNFVVGEKLAQPRNQQKTDVQGALLKTSAFFNEPDIADSSSDKVIFFVSDGRQTAKKRAGKIRINADVRVFAVGCDAEQAQQWFGRQVDVFENISAAVAFLTSNKGANNVRP